MSTTESEVTPAEQPLGPIQAARLSALTGLPASELEGQTVAALSQRLRWVVDPDLWLFRRVCGQVVQVDPATGADLPVPYATVEVFDTVCDYWGFFPEPWPWGWLFPVHCERELVATVQTDACGNFCFWVPAFEIEWILRWREERVCFPEIFTKPTIADLLAGSPGQPASGQPASGQPATSDAAALAVRLRAGGDLGSALGARAGAVLRAARAATGVGDHVSQLTRLLASPAFPKPVTPPLPALPAHDGKDGQAVAIWVPPQIDPGRFYGPFQRCIDVFVPEWYEFLAVPDLSIVVTQALGSGPQVIYEGAFDIPWGTNPIPPLTLQASPVAVASRAPCPPSQVDPDTLGFQYVGLLPVSAPYNAGGTFDAATGFATRVNQPQPPAGGCSCDQADLAVVPACPATAVFYGELYLYGGVTYPGAAYYRITTQYAAGSGIPTPSPATFSLPVPLLDSWTVPQPFPAPPAVIAPASPDGWYPISGLSAESGPYTGMLMDWSDAKADGVYGLTLELADASMTPITLSTAPTLLLVVDGSRPQPGPLTVQWQPTIGVNGPIDPTKWTTAYPPASGCALIDTGGGAIALQFTTGATAPHLRQAWVGVGGCGGVNPVPATGNPPAFQWYTGSTDPSATSFSFSGVYYLPAGAPAGCYQFELYADTRAFNAAGGTTSDPVHTGWCGNEPDAPYTNPVISVAII
ncbi:MAG TPA: hypothetical protein VI365_28210 [Trebonia sp.]